MAGSLSPDYLPVETVRDPETGQVLGTIPAGGDAEPLITAARLQRERARVSSLLWDATLKCDLPDSPEVAEAKRLLDMDWRQLQMGSDRALNEINQAAAIAAAPQPDMPGTRYRHSRYYSHGNPGQGTHHGSNPHQSRT